ncbi:TolC family protein [Hydrogenimonas sp. SS33]|uniref:TolC family protein n=1 Tax=Hydrogenimonas leucolamina TaxID=2954236 RepID=UPI00336BFA52
MKKTLLAMALTLPLFAVQQNLSLQRALEMVKENNLEVKVAEKNVLMKEQEHKAAVGYNFGSLDLVVNALRSNDAGNVFGFKLQSREASFADFGFDQFLAPMRQALMLANNNALTQQDLQNMNVILAIQPDKLNYPDARNHFQEKIQYKIPLYVGGRLMKYGEITDKMTTISKLDRQKILNEKLFETRKTYYNISLVENFIKNLNVILKNVEELEDTVKNMVKEGYALDIDLLQVQTKKADVLRMINQAKLNRDLAYQYLSFLVDDKVDSIVVLDNDVPMPHMKRDEMLARNIDIQKAHTGLEVTDLAIGVEKSKFLPTVGAFAEYGSADNTFLNDFTDKDAYTVGVQLKWNLFNGFVDKAKYEKAKIQNMKMQEQVELAKKGIGLKIDKIITSIKSKDYDIQSLREKVKYTKKVYDNYYSRYKEGLMAINDVLIKNSEHIQAVLNLVKTRFERNNKVFELENIINKGIL